VAYSNNVNGRGSHDHCIDAIKTTQRVGPDYGIKLGTIDNDEQSKRREAYISLGGKPSDILSHPDDDEHPTPSRYAKYGVKMLGVPLGSQEFMENSSKKSFGASAMCFATMTYNRLGSCSACANPAPSTTCSDRYPPSIILKHAHIFDDNLRRAVRRIFKVQLSDTEWRRLKLPCSQGGIFDIYNVAIAGYIA
jgi:hypothetical protein